MVDKSGSNFGTTYKIEYEIEPGPRDVYALVVLPCRAKTLVIDRVVEQSFSTSGFSRVFDYFKILKEREIEFTQSVKNIGNTKDGGTSQNIGPMQKTPDGGGGLEEEPQMFRVIKADGGGNGGVKAMGTLPHIYALQTMFVAGQDNPLWHYVKAAHGSSTYDGKFMPSTVIELGYTCPAAKGGTIVEPPKLFPKTISELFVSGPNITSETQVFLGGVPLPGKNVRLVGRNKIVVSVPPDAGLAEFMDKHFSPKTPPGAPPVPIPVTGPLIPLTYYTPGMSQPSLAFQVELVRSGPAPKPSYSLSPEFGVVGTHVKVSAKNTPVDFQLAQNVLIGGKVAPIIAGLTKKDSLVFIVPKATEPYMPHSLNVVVEFNPLSSMKAVQVPMPFEYIQSNHDH